MSDTINGNFTPNCSDGANEAVCLDVMRVYDSCGSKDCLEDLNVYFIAADQSVVDTARGVRLRDVEIIDAIVEIEAMPFRRGYYTVRITYYFNVLLDVTTATSTTVPVRGLAVFTKQTVLYGGEGSVRMYTSDTTEPEEVAMNNLPRVNVQTADPVLLGSRLVTSDEPIEIPFVPEEILALFDGELVTGGARRVLVSIGLFSIVQVVRNVQMLVPAYDFCIPCKECISTYDDPCDLFSRMRFPKNEFFPTAQKYPCRREEDREE